MNDRVWAGVIGMDAFESMIEMARSISVGRVFWYGYHHAFSFWGRTI